MRIALLAMPIFIHVRKTEGYPEIGCGFRIEPFSPPR